MKNRSDIFSQCRQAGRMAGRICRLILPALVIVLSGQIKAQTNSTPLSFTGATLISGTGGAVNAVYKFSSVTSGVDAHVTLAAISNSASMSNVDIPASTAGYDPAFQPTVTIAAGTSGSPKTSYIEWQIRFKKAGTSTDTSLSNISATAIDVDGNSSLQERVQAYTPSSYSVNSPNELTVTTDGVSVTALGSTTDYSGIDSANKAVMFQMNFEDVNLITYRTGGVNKTSATSRQFSIYFKAFFTTSTPLPVELIYFKAETIDKRYVNLSWATGSELNNAYFTIERSTDGQEYEELTSVAGAGTCSHSSYYKYIDYSPETGNNYYRLVQTDHDGHQKIYEPIMAKIDGLSHPLEIESFYPNPFKDDAKVTLSTRNNTGLQLALINANGIEEKVVLGDAVNGNSTLELKGLAELRSGVYYLQASQNGVVSNTIRLLKN